MLTPVANERGIIQIQFRTTFGSLFKSGLTKRHTRNVDLKLLSSIFDRMKRVKTKPTSLKI